MTIPKFIQRRQPIAIALTLLVVAVSPGWSASSLVLETVRESNPKTPVQLITAVENLVRVGEVEAAREYLQALMDSKLDQKALAALHANVGPAMILRLAAETRLAPLSGQFSRQVLTAATAVATDPGALSAKIQQATQATPLKRESLLADLQNHASEATVATIRLIAGNSDAEELERLTSILESLATGATEPLIAALDSPDTNVQVAAIRALAVTRSWEAKLHLLYPLLSASEIDPAVRQAATDAWRHWGDGKPPSTSEAVTVLQREVTARLQDQKRFVGRPDIFPDITAWQWDSAAKTVTTRRHLSVTAAAIDAAKLARHLYALCPTSYECETLYLVANLEAAGWLGERAAPLRLGSRRQQAKFSAYRADSLERALCCALDWEMPVSATGAAQLLGEVGDARLLIGGSGEPRPLVQAIRYPDRRLQMAAVDAILRLNPTHLFPGSDWVTNFLLRAIQTDGRSQAVLVHSQDEQAYRLAGILNSFGIETDVVETAYDALQQITSGPDYEMVLVSDSVGAPGWYELLQQLRRDPRSADLPIGLIPQVSEAAAAEYLAEQDPRTTWLPLPQDTATAATLVAELARLRGPYPVTAEIRADQANRCMEWIARLTQSPQFAYFDLAGHAAEITHGLYIPRLTPLTIEALGNLGTPNAQSALADFVYQPATASTPDNLRTAAMKALDRAIQRTGVQITNRRIQIYVEGYQQWLPIASRPPSQETAAEMNRLLVQLQGPPLHPIVP